MWIYLNRWMEWATFGDWWDIPEQHFLNHQRWTLDNGGRKTYLMYVAM